MMIKRTELIKTALNTLNPVDLMIEDESADHLGHSGAKSGGGHFAISITSPLFVGKTRVQRHQMIYKALGTLMQSDIHAITIIAKTPSEV